MTSKHHDLIDLLEKILEKEISINYYTELIKPIGYKLGAHAKSLSLLSKSIFDISSLIAIIRAQLETYTTFYFLYKKGIEEERIFRFNLWKLDGIKERRKFSITLEDFTPDEQEAFLTQIREENEQIEYLEGFLSSHVYLKEIPIEYQKKVIHNSQWKFDLNKMIRKEKKFMFSIKEMVENTNIKKLYVEDMYSYFSMHSHTNYISVIQNQQTTEETFEVTDNYINRYSMILLTYFIDLYLEIMNQNIEDYSDKNHIYFYFKKIL